MKNSYSILIALFIVGSTFAQSPEQMSYQATVSDATGSLVTNQLVGMQISILQTTVGGTAVYVETQTTTTNANGLVSIAIGTGTPVNGTFATIDWSADTYFIKTETDPTGGTSYSLTNTSQLLSVPYALYAKTATTAITAANGIPAGGTNAQVLQMVEGVPTWITFSLFYKDTDGDSYGDINSAIGAGAAPNGYIANNTDCNDTDFNEYPGQTWYIDADADGYGSISIVACARAINGFLLSELLGNGTDDCDDTDPLVNNTNQTWYVDADGDNFGGSSVVACARAINGFLLSELLGNGTDDCDDTDPLVNNPNQTWYIDADGDGYGSSSIVACARAANAFLLSELLGSGTDDCEDTDPTINPTTVWYADLDGDGYGRGNNAGQTGCTSTLTNATQDNTDCIDWDPAINPASVWYADLDGDGFGDATSSETGCVSTLTNATLDNTDCSDSDPTLNPVSVWYADLDGDGFGDATSSEIGCTSTLTNATLDNTDCNDGDPAIYPGRLEIAGDGIDNNCDGRLDELDIGQFLGGGIVFWVDPTDNTRSLVCAIKDQSAGIPWYNGNNTAVSYTETAIKTGASNTVNIIKKYGDIATNYAAGMAKTYTNAKDWSLPSKDALNEMYLNKTAINAALTALGGNVLSGSYWSSSEVNSELAWGQSFVNGNQDENLKYYDGHKVRAVREYPNYIGQIIDDGVVFYLTNNATTDLDGDGDYDLGLICAFSDSGPGEWGCLGVEFTLGEQIGAGMQNTNTVLSNCPTAGAFVAARSLGANWFLPSYSELREIYINRTAINATLTALGGAAVALKIDGYDTFYWSSTPIAPYAGSDGIGKWADVIDFGTGQPRIEERRWSYSVRSVRAF
ncbi:putative metal-binding motif-containing protein [Maribacter arcticus]|nr:MopE-related protein [Maribacter arcticus]MDA9089696.1 putative metal-binding motif-containing protein [Maribacter arcticus]